MPCTSCNKTIDYNRADISVWGPLLWKLLHSLSIKRTVIADENQLQLLKNKWKFIFDTLWQVVPCEECRNHVIEYMRETRQPDWKTIVTEAQLSDILIDWFYTFHSAVNTRLGKPVFPKAALVETYSAIDVRALFKEHVRIMVAFVYASDVRILIWNQWKTNMMYLMSMYAV